jgi:CcmD family protein
MLFLQAPPDTSRFLIAGYTIAIVVMLLYVLSLYLRQRRLERDLQDLEELVEEQPETVVTT